MADPYGVDRDVLAQRQILSRVEGAYYFRPSVVYDFLRQPNGQKFGGVGFIVNCPIVYRFL